MERGERERWNKLTDDAKAVARLMSKYSDTGRVHMNDFRMQIDLSELNSRAVLDVWRELASRAYGHIKDEDGPDPVFVMNVPAFQTLSQTRRLTDQAPHRPEGD
jgi:hypothetical protein